MKMPKETDRRLQVYNTYIKKVVLSKPTCSAARPTRAHLAENEFEQRSELRLSPRDYKPGAPAKTSNVIGGLQKTPNAGTCRSVISSIQCI
jgi:hypothetical protein